MTSDQLVRPRTGTVAGARYVALPPTAVDADTDGPAPLIVAWHGFTPPRTEAAFAAALPMTGVPAWRVYLRLPEPAADDYLLELFGPAVERAAGALPEAVAELRAALSADEGPIGLVGFSAGGAAALLALAEGAVAVRAAALVAPVAIPERVVAALDRRHHTAYPWNERSQELAERMDFVRRAAEIAARDTSLMFICGEGDDLVTPSDMAEVREALVGHGVRRVDAITLRMGHRLAAEPGVVPEPPIAEAVSVDSALTDWFRRRLR